MNRAHDAWENSITSNLPKINVVAKLSFLSRDKKTAVLIAHMPFTAAVEFTPDLENTDF